jgi:hypothetical protein
MLQPVQLFSLNRACYSVTETLQILSISRRKLYLLIRDGVIIPGKLGKKTLIYASDIAALLDRMRAAA